MFFKVLHRLCSSIVYIIVYNIDVINVPIKIKNVNKRVCNGSLSNKFVNVWLQTSSRPLDSLTLIIPFSSTFLIIKLMILLISWLWIAVIIGNRVVEMWSSLPARQKHFITLSSFKHVWGVLILTLNNAMQSLRLIFNINSIVYMHIGWTAIVG